MYQYNLSDPLNEDANEETEREFALKALFENIRVGWNLNLKWWMRKRQIDDPCPDDVEIGDSGDLMAAFVDGLLRILGKMGCSRDRHNESAGHRGAHISNL